MGKAIVITRSDRSAAELHRLAVEVEDGAIVRRLPGIAMLAARASGMDRQTLPPVATLLLGRRLVSRHCANTICKSAIRRTSLFSSSVHTKSAVNDA